MELNALAHELGDPSLESIPVRPLLLPSLLQAPVYLSCGRHHTQR